MSWNVTPSHEEIALLMEAGFICRDANNFEEAREIFEGVQAMLPQSEVVDVALGTIEFHQGRFDSATRRYLQALEKNPRSAYAHAHLGEVYLFKMKQDEARRHLRAAIELDPRGDFGKLARGLMEFTNVVRFNCDIDEGSHGN
ncbi:MAG: tetratricopeptide repeat protein [Acidobacteria bacterium]|nr:tetratricopeptide repeat protein [Acidobacteriota bacterium]MCI0717453.1 tetratricopeptide repeat protein [Acidobacteriota bacterium]